MLGYGGPPAVVCDDSEVLLTVPRPRLCPDRALVSVPLEVDVAEQYGGAEERGLGGRVGSVREGDAERLAVREHLLGDAAPLFAEYSDLALSVSGHHRELDVGAALTGPAGAGDAQPDIAVRAADAEAGVEHGELLCDGAEQHAAGRHLELLETAEAAAAVAPAGRTAVSGVALTVAYSTVSRILSETGKANKHPLLWLQLSV